MTYRSIVDLVLKDLLDEGRRADAKEYVNHRYWWLWTLHEWTFVYADAAVTVTAASNTLGAVPSNVRTPIALLWWDGTPLLWLEPAEFFELYHGDTGTGAPRHWTRVADSYFVGPKSSETRADLKFLYEQEFAALVNDEHVPLLPAGAHFGLVHGGRAEAMKLQHNPTWQDVENDFLQTITILERGYLAPQRSGTVQLAAYRP